MIPPSGETRHNACAPLSSNAESARSAFEILESTILRGHCRIARLGNRLIAYSLVAGRWSLFAVRCPLLAVRWPRFVGRWSPGAVRSPRFGPRFAAPSPKPVRRSLPPARLPVIYPRAMSDWNARRILKELADDKKRRTILTAFWRF